MTNYIQSFRDRAKDMRWARQEITNIPLNAKTIAEYKAMVESAMFQFELRSRLFDNIADEEEKRVKADHVPGSPRQR